MPHKRSRAWRRAQRQRFIEKRSILTQNHPNLRARSHRGQLSKTSPDSDRGHREKNWADMYFHRFKVKRAQQLGAFWPHPKREWAKREIETRLEL